jgi:flagellar motor switch protein FliM
MSSSKTPSELLSPEEISKLLDADGGAKEKRPRVAPYNFRRPDRFSKDQVRALYLLHDLFAHNISTSLPVFLRVASEIALMSVEQQSYGDFVQSLSDPTAIFTLALDPLPGVAALELDPEIAFPIIDRMLGGAGAELTETRAATEIEQKLLEGFLKPVIDDLREAWRPLVEIAFEITGRETRPPLLQIAAANEVVLSFVFHLQIAEARGMMRFCLPAAALEPVVSRLNQSNLARQRAAAPAETRSLLDTLARVDFLVAVETRPTPISIKEILAAAEGDVLLLAHRLEDALAVTVGGIEKFQGQIAAHQNRIVVSLEDSATVN